MNIQPKIPSDIAGENNLIIKYTQNYQELNLLTLEKKETLHLFQELVIWNKQTHIFPYNLLQRLWIKLIKKYKYKHQDWDNIFPQHSLHFYLIDESGNGLQSLIKFYQKRLLFEWKN